ncbi:hypothetical protein, partial [Streptomyces sp. MA25(2023)]|uniref:hypothetical protein n=1 Tax=Streptomyces sp. MA25(2023) TaxID=3055078 RepID=UPI0025AFB8F9
MPPPDVTAPEARRGSPIIRAHAPPGKWLRRRSHRPELPAYLDRIILDLLAKRPDRRPDDARELGRRITAGRTSP